MDNNSLLKDLTTDEAATLNGGYRCYYAWVIQWFWTYYGRAYRYVQVTRCY